MKALLENINYSFTSDGITNAEIKAYASAISLENESFDTLFENIFILTASSDTLTKYEIMLGIENSSSDLSDRRERIIQRLSENYGYFSISDFEDKIDEVGESLSVSVSDNTILFSGFSSNDYAKIRALNLVINSYMPCFLNSSLGTKTLNFDDWDNMNISFFELDKLKFRFDNV